MWLVQATSPASFALLTAMTPSRYEPPPRALTLSDARGAASGCATAALALTATRAWAVPSAAMGTASYEPEPSSWYLRRVHVCD